MADLSRGSGHDTEEEVETLASILAVETCSDDSSAASMINSEMAAQAVAASFVGAVSKSCRLKTKASIGVSGFGMIQRARVRRYWSRLRASSAR